VAGLFAWLSAGSRRREASEWRRLLTRHGFIILKDSNVLNLYVLTNRLHFLTKQFISLPFRQTSELHGIQVGSGHGRDSGDGRSSSGGSLHANLPNRANRTEPELDPKW